MSTITYDPGDEADFARVMLETVPPQLDQSAFDDLIIALKVQELLVPNLPLFWRIPAVDGYDGGVLPLQRYNQLVSLLAPPNTLIPDGRLREQIRDVPSAALLGLLDVQYLVTDKTRDLWFDDVFYDRQIGLRLTPDAPQGAIDAPSAFAATHVHLIVTRADSDAGAAAAGAPLATVEVVAAAPVTATEYFTITAGEGAPRLQRCLPRRRSQAAWSIPMARVGGRSIACPCRSTPPPMWRASTCALPAGQRG